MKIQVTFDNYSVGNYPNLDVAKEAILENFAEGVLPEQVVETFDDGEETGKGYGCTWSVSLEELPS